MIKITDKVLDYFIQVVLIVGSVLLALWLDQLMADRAENKKVKLAISNILSEADNNIKALEDVVYYHQEVAANISSFGDSVDIKSLDRNALQIIGNFIPYGLQVAGLQNTAWTMAIETEAIALFDYNMAYDMTALYDLQDRGVTSTTQKIMDYLTNPSLFDIEENEEVVRVFQFAMQELANQEAFLIEESKEFLDKYRE